MRLATPLILASAAAALVACGKGNQAADTTGMGATTGAMAAPATSPPAGAPAAGGSAGAAGGMAGMSTGAAAGSTSTGGMKGASDTTRKGTRHSPTTRRP